MNSKQVKGTPLDYSEDKIVVYLEVVNKIGMRAAMEHIHFADIIEELESGFSMEMAIQQIPELIKCLVQENIAIYAVVRENNVRLDERKCQVRE
jgi:hypothetical protein